MSPTAGFGSFFRRASGGLNPSADSGSSLPSASFLSTFGRQQADHPLAATSSSTPEARTVTLPEGYEDVSIAERENSEHKGKAAVRTSVESNRSDIAKSMSEVKL